MQDVEKVLGEVASSFSEANRRIRQLESDLRSKDARIEILESHKRQALGYREVLERISEAVHRPRARFPGARFPVENEVKEILEMEGISEPRDWMIQVKHGSENTPVIGSFTTEKQAEDFRRLELAGPSNWEVVPAWAQA